MTGIGYTRRHLGKTALGAVVLGALPTGCSQEAMAREDTLITEAWPAGTTFNNYNNLNPFTVGNDLRNHITFIYEGLFYWAALTSQHIPYLAQSFEYDAEFTSVTVRLREGVTWSDGRPFGADDVVATFEMLRKNGEGKNDLFFAKDVSAVLRATTKVDERTVRFDLVQRDPRFVLRTLTVKFNTGIHILPAHVLTAVTDPASFQNYDPENGLPVGTGPYRLGVAAPERILLDRRDDWWGAKPGMWDGDQAGAFYTDLPVPRRIITIPRAEAQQAAQQIAAERVDWIVEAPVPIMKQLLAEYPSITTLTDREPPYGYVDWWPTSLYFNHDSPKVAERELRLAIRYAINAQQAIDIFHEGAAELMVSPMPALDALKPYNDDLAPVAEAKELNAFDPARSAELMTGLGFAKDGEGFWARDGQRWTGAIFGPPPLEAIGPILVEQLRRAGFSTTWNKPSDYAQAVYTGKPDMILWGHSGSVFDPQDTMLLYHSRFYRPVGEVTTRFHRWRNSRFDELADQVGTLPVKDEAIRPLVKEAFSIWMDEVVEVPISQWYHRIPFNTRYWSGWPTAANPYVTPTISHWTSCLVVHGLQKQSQTA